MSNKDLILKEFDILRGQFVIDQSWNIERLIAIAEDADDYYYCTYNGRKISFNSCVGRIIPLKGKLDKKDYNYLVDIAKMNDYDFISKKDGNLIEYKNELIKEYSYVKFITEFEFEFKL